MAYIGYYVRPDGIIEQYDRRGGPPEGGWLGERRLLTGWPTPTMRRVIDPAGDAMGWIGCDEHGVPLDIDLDAEEALERAIDEVIARAERGDPIEWRVYDRTGGDVTHDLPGKLTADEAIAAGRDWMRQADWERGTHRWQADAEVAPLVRGADGEPDEGATLEARQGHAWDCGIDIEPAGPPRTACGEEDDDHDWSADHALVGGCKESPGVWGSNHGAVVVERVCRACGLKRVTDYGATNPADGTQTTMVVYTEDGPED